MDFDQTILLIYQIFSMNAAGILLYHGFLSIIQYQKTKAKISPWLAALSLSSAVNCFVTIASLYSDNAYFQMLLAHTLTLTSTIGCLVYFRLMSVYINYHPKFLRFIENYIILGLMVIGVSTISFMGSEVTFLYEIKPFLSNSIYIQASGGMVTITPYGIFVIQSNVTLLTFASFFFLRKILVHNKPDKMLILGILCNILFMINDAMLAFPLIKYAFPLLFCSYFVEILRLTYLTQRDSALKIQALEGEIIQIGKVAELGYVAGNIAHDLRNPVALIKGSAHLVAKTMKKGPEIVDASKPSQHRNALAQKYIANIFSGCERIETIIQTYLKMMYHENGETEELTISGVLDQAVNLCSSRLNDLGPKVLKLDIQDFKLNGYENQLVMSFVNLLSNSCEAIADCQEKWIEVSTMTQGNIAFIIMKDSGKIPEEVAKNLFRKGFTTKSKGKGTGLGLAFVRKVILNHNGTIYLDTKNQNTCFIIKLSKVIAISPEKAAS